MKGSATTLVNLNIEDVNDVVATTNADAIDDDKQKRARRRIVTCQHSHTYTITSRKTGYDPGWNNA